MTEPFGPPPTPTVADRAAQVLISTAGEVPLAGPIVTALLQTFGTAYGQRLDVWRQRLYETFHELRERDLLDEATQRPEWVTAVHDATRIALGEHLEAKLDMLKAILINAAERADDRLSDVLTLRYLRWVDDFEPEHIAALRYCETRAHSFGQAANMTPDQHARLAAIEEMGAEILTVVAGDLDDRGLLSGHEIEITVTPAPGGDRHRGDFEPSRVREDLSNAYLTSEGARFLDWLRTV